MRILEISQRIASLRDSHKECMLLISRLAKLDGTGSAADSARTELANVIHQNLKDAEQELELLVAQVEDEDEGADGLQTSLSSKVGKLVEDMKIARLQYRKAQLSAKRNAQLAEQRDREMLLGSSGRSTPDSRRRGGRNQQLSQNDLLLNASTDVTTALRRTHTLLQSELSRSRFATETLTASTAALQGLTHRYSVFDDVISSSRVLISDLVRKNRSDRWYYEKAIQILVGLLVWILVRRLLWGPVYLVVGVPLRIVWWGLSLVGSVMGIGGSGIDEGLGKMSRVGGGGGGGEITRGPATIEIAGIPGSLLTRPPSARAMDYSYEEEWQFRDGNAGRETVGDAHDEL